MKGFVAGLIVGGVLALVVPTFAAEVVGGNGFLHRWSVVRSDGTEICAGSYIRPSLHEIECED